MPPEDALRPRPPVVPPSRRQVACKVHSTILTNRATPAGRQRPPGCLRAPEPPPVGAHDGGVRRVNMDGIGAVTVWLVSPAFVKSMAASAVTIEELRTKYLDAVGVDATLLGHRREPPAPLRWLARHGGLGLHGRWSSAVGGWLAPASQHHRTAVILRAVVVSSAHGAQPQNDEGRGDRGLLVFLCSSCWTRTSDPAVNSRLLYRLS